MKDSKDRNEYESKIETKARNTVNDQNPRFPRHASFQGVNRLFALAFDNTDNGDNKVERDNHRKCSFQE